MKLFFDSPAFQQIVWEQSETEVNEYLQHSKGRNDILVHVLATTKFFNSALKRQFDTEATTISTENPIPIKLYVKCR